MLKLHGSKGGPVFLKYEWREPLHFLKWRLSLELDILVLQN